MVTPHWPFKEPGPPLERPSLHRIGWMGDLVLIVALIFGGIVAAIGYIVHGGLW